MEKSVRDMNSALENLSDVQADLGLLESMIRLNREHLVKDKSRLDSISSHARGLRDRCRWFAVEVAAYFPEAQIPYELRDRNVIVHVGRLDRWVEKMRSA
jgi:hypothetical protein